MLVVEIDPNKVPMHLILAMGCANLSILLFVFETRFGRGHSLRFRDKQSVRHKQWL
jgi:hypothetical protein